MSLYDIHGNIVSSGGGSLVDDSLFWNFKKWEGKHLVTDGNSLVAHNNWGDYLAAFLGMTHTNCAMSGGSLTRYDETMGYTKEDIIANIANAYPETCDLVILQGDTNVTMAADFSDQMDGDNPKDTWTARMNFMIRCIKAKYHNAVIVLMPDSVRYDNNVPSHELEKNRTCYEAMKGVAEYNRIAFFDFDHATPYNPQYVDNYYAWTGDPDDLHNFKDHGQDFVHPSPHSYTEHKGKALAHFIAGLVFDPDAPNTAAEGWSNQYTITYNLEDGVTISNTTESLWANVIYIATLTGATNVAITMGGVDITSEVYNAQHSRIRLPGITGNVVITAS